MVGLAALDDELQAVLALFGDRDLDRRPAAAVGELAAQGAALLRQHPAVGILHQVLAVHEADVPAGLVDVVHPGDREHIPVFIHIEALSGPFGGSLFGFLLFFAAGRQRKDHAQGQQQAEQFFHVVLLFSQL